MSEPGRTTRASRQTLASIGESILIERIRRWLGAACPPSPAGIGDDCAVLPRTGHRMLVTVDPVIRGRHFDASLPPARVAEKLLKRNLSDIAAMGGTPAHAVVALNAPGDLEVSWLEGFFRGLGRVALRYDVRIVGGDCARSDDFLSASLTLIGRAPARILTRAGARAGDRLFVTGSLGGSLFGRHIRFEPRLAEGRWLAGRDGVRAAIDLSDGLGKDLFSIVPDGLCAVLDPQQIPLASAARRAARASGSSALDHAINDGEDYELLIAVKAKNAGAIARAWAGHFATPLSEIGRIEIADTKAARVRFAPEPRTGGVRFRGYEHF